MKQVFFDTEFTGLRKDTTLISIGLICSDGKAFYAEMTDYDESQVDDWIQKNVIDNMMNLHETGHFDFVLPEYYHRGDTEFIRPKLLKWLNSLGEFEFISDVAHYDMVLLIGLLADSALDLPNNIPATCRDINQMLAEFHDITTNEAFDISRADMLDYLDKEIEGVSQHNALYDALMIREIYNMIAKK